MTQQSKNPRKITRESYSEVQKKAKHLPGKNLGLALLMRPRGINGREIAEPMLLSSFSSLPQEAPVHIDQEILD